MVSVFAINVRKGNVIEKDGKLYVVIKAENIHPGKGTPVTQIEMRRIADGVKVNERFKTTDQLEKAFIDSRQHNYLYQDGDHFVYDGCEFGDYDPGDVTIFDGYKKRSRKSR